MKRAAISVPANITEGFKRNSRKDSMRFYRIADASLAELQYFIILARDLNYISEPIKNELFKQSEELGRVLGGWMSSQ